MAKRRYARELTLGNQEETLTKRMRPERQHRTRFFRWAVLILLAMIAVGTKAWSDTMSTPVIQRTSLAVRDFPKDMQPVTVALISDIHIAGPDMPPERFQGIVAQINGLAPDYLMIAGDFVSEKRTATKHYNAQQIIAPLTHVDGSIIKIAVLGNHDHWFDESALRSKLERAGFAILANEARRFGPLAVGGLDDDFTGRADLPSTLRQLGQLQGAKIILSHSPDPFPDLPDGFGPMLAGHTHCGQLRYPWGGSPATMSDYGNRYACGRVDENANTIITSAGLGTSVLPIRLFSKPEIWLIEIGPEQ